MASAQPRNEETRGAQGAARPARALALVSGAGALAAAAGVFVVTSTGWLGARFAPPTQGAGLVIVDVAPGGPLARAGVAAGERLTSLADAEAGVSLSRGDLVADPDMLGDHGKRDAFLRRQNVIAGVLASPSARAEIAGADGSRRVVTLAPARRPISSLPLPFWLQILSGMIGLIVGAWLWLLRRSDPAARRFALSGLGLWLAAASPLYAARELALSGALTGGLSILNHFGAMLVGVGVTTTFLDYPRRIGPIWAAPAIGALYFAVFVFDVSGVAAPRAFYLLALFEIIAVGALWAAQALACRDDPRRRAALIWVGLSIAAAIAPAFAAVIAPIGLGLEATMAQGYVYVFFAAAFVSVAFGVGRHRLFDLGRWAYRILFTALGAAALVTLDALFIYVLGVERAPALSLSILTVGLAYLPARDAVWRRYVAPKRAPTHETFAKAMDVAFAVEENERARRWRELLDDLFDPLEIEASGREVVSPRALPDGATMLTPALAGSPALALKHPYGGKALFSADDVRLAGRIVELVRRAERGRDEYARGVIEERARIARDLHDDLGARLVSGAVGAQGDARALSQAALADLRGILADLSGGVALDEGLADIRQEAARRLAEAGLAIDWPPIAEELSAHLIARRQLKELSSCVREGVTNAIRHAQARRLAARIGVAGERLVLTLSDDGRGFPERIDPDGRRRGRGVQNMRARMRAAGGEMRLEARARGVTLIFELPLAAGESTPGRGRRPTSAGDA